MKTLETSQFISAGKQKIREYVNRIRSGESRDSIFQGLPMSFRSDIEKELGGGSAGSVEDNMEDINEIPPQYEGLDSETLDFIWIIPEYIDSEKTRKLREAKIRVLALLKEKELKEKAKIRRQEFDEKKIDQLRQKLGVAKPKEVVKVEENNEIFISNVRTTSSLSIEERKKLHGWDAGYELARIAQQQGIDLSAISREDYVEFAIQNSLAIDDSQLRMASWQRMATSAKEIVSANKEIRSKINKDVDQSFAIFCRDIQQKAGEENRFLQEGIKVRQGTGKSNSWLFFGINNGIGKNSSETFKSYISVKNLNILTPEKFMQLMVALRDAKYNGDIKIFQDLSAQGVNLNDQIVMHGASQADAELALKVAEKFFGAELDQKSVGKDEIINGENKSYSEILAKKIKDAIN